MNKVLMIVGSLRKDSFNHQLSCAAAELLSKKANVTVLHYADIPFMNQDIEFPTPLPIARVRKEVESADGIWFFTPEYNYHIPGVLKNLLDWLSRPLIPGDPARKSVLSQKPVTISGVAGKSAAAGARGNLANLLKILSTEVIGGTGTGISLTAEAFATNTLCLTEDVRQKLASQAESLLQALN